MEKYFCLKCKKYHYRGKIYKNHLCHKRNKEQEASNPQEDIELIPSNKIMEFNYKRLRPIAKRQINRLFKKMKSLGDYDTYRREINRLIIYEKSKSKGV